MFDAIIVMFPFHMSCRGCHGWSSKVVKLGPAYLMFSWFTIWTKKNNHFVTDLQKKAGLLD